MSEKTHIAWTDSTVNFWSGCTKVSAGCAHCYAESLSNRGMGNIGKWGKGAPRQLHESAFKLAVRLNKKPWICDECGTAYALRAQDADSPECCHAIDDDGTECRSVKYHRRRIFSLSLGDIFDPEVPIEWPTRELHTIFKCDQCVYQLLTKRPELGIDLLTKCLKYAVFNASKFMSPPGFMDWLDSWCQGKPPEHVWIGTSVENQECADKRIRELLKIPAAKRFLSCEPLLGPVDLGKARALPVFQFADRPIREVCGLTQKTIGVRPDLAGMWSRHDGNMQPWIDWVIVGGESGRVARPCNVDWIRSIKDQCKAAGVAFFMKQTGANLIHMEQFGHGKLQAVTHQQKHPKGGDPAEWPEDLRVQEFPI